MTVKSLVGKVDTNDVIFTQIETGQWSCVVPFTESGKYVVELYATDEAGNQSYFAKVLFTIDTDNLISTISILEYNTDLTDFPFVTTLDSIYTAELIQDTKYELFLMEPVYIAELVSNLRC